MESHRPLALFIYNASWNKYPWVREIARQAAPPDFDVEFCEGTDTATLQRLLPRADFVVTTNLTAAAIALLRRCKLVQHQGVGYDGIDAVALARAGIPLAVTTAGTIIGVAEHTILLILALYKQIVRVHESLRRGEYDQMGWRADSHFFFGKTLGIVGLGRIGRRVAQLARAFDINMIYYDAVRAPQDVERELGITFVSFEELVGQSDVITVHVPAIPETRGLFNRDTFARMKRGTLFINTSRGETYDMDALCQFLQNGHLGGAGLDVFNPEPPPPDHPILQLPNVICTPHMATGTIEAHHEKARAQFENMQRVLRGESIINLVKDAR
ncbi:MAG TPA: NAD(P)-dependent oxidoreductase [Anaerolineae bacterium]|nr:NAD(P)-dependent oxidoreductase [Anaerolineae bacterium]